LPTKLRTLAALYDCASSCAALTRSAGWSSAMSELALFRTRRRVGPLGLWPSCPCHFQIPGQCASSRSAFAISQSCRPTHVDLSIICGRLRRRALYAHGHHISVGSQPNSRDRGSPPDRPSHRLSAENPRRADLWSQPSAGAEPRHRRGPVIPPWQ
jgi:hypothetical protein